MDSKLIGLLVCPVTKGPLELSANKEELISKSAKLAYPIKDGIPIMLELQARVLSQEECER
ncbi:MAG: Trm112 family protein [Betaproteobacteria bacterium]